MNDEQQWRRLSHRAKHRLRIAARLLRQQGNKFHEGNFYEQVLQALSKINTTAKEQLRGLVDWVEEYELEEKNELQNQHDTLPRVENHVGRKRFRASVSRRQIQRQHQND